MNHNTEGYSHPGPGTARPGSSFYDRDTPKCGLELGVAANLREATTLEKCRDQAMDNMHSINDIGSRITGLLTRLRGLEPRTGCGSDGDSEPRGMLVVHIEQLEYEARRLGEIQADLAVLESLL